MSKFQLNIRTKGNTIIERINLSPSDTVRMKVSTDTQYQVIDANGQLVKLDSIPKTKMINSDLYIYLEEGITEPSLILENYQSFAVLENAELLSAFNTTFATTSVEGLVNLPVLASEIVTASTVSSFGSVLSSTAFMVGGGVIATAAGVVAVAEHRNNNSDNNTNNSSDRKEEAQERTVVPLADPIIELDLITGDNIIQYVESKQETITLNGKVTNVAYSAAKAGDMVEITAGTTRVSAPLEEKNGELVFSVPIGTVALINHAAEGLSLSLVTSDSANNSKTTIKQHAYNVNLERDIQLDITSIAGDDMLNKAESTANVDIVGRVTNGEKDETVEIWCSCAICNTGWKLVESVMLTENGDFTLSVNGAVLNDPLPNGEKPKIKAVYKTKSDTQLANTAKVEDSREYTIDTELTKPVTSTPKLKINGNGVTISGELARIDSDVKNSDIKVTVTIDGQSHQATVSEDKRTWTLEQPNTELLSFENKKVAAKVNVTDKAGNTNESDEVEAELLPKIDITAIGENFSVDNTGELVTISGEIVYKDLFARGKNAAQVRLVKVRIGEKVYEVPLNADWKTFDLKLPLVDALALNGKAISIEFNRVQVFTPKTNTDGSIGFNNVNNQTVTTESITLKSDYITPNAANNGYNLTVKAPSSVISGKVIGDNIVGGEKVTITVGDKVFNDVVVEQDKTFRLEVENKLLAELSDKKVTATLSTTNLAGDPIQVSDVEHYTATSQVSGTYGQALHADVEGNARKFNHQSDEFNFAYFMDPFYSAKLGSVGYHRMPFGGQSEATPVIKYHFVTKEELAIHDPNANKPLNISALQKDAFTKAYQYLEKFINVKFEQVDHYITDRTGTNIFAKVHDGGGAAYAGVGDGASIWVNSTYGNEDGSTNAPRIANLYNNVLNYVYYATMHEVLHTLGLNHSNVLFTNPNRTGKYGGLGAGALEDHVEFTYMSYNGFFGTKGTYLPFYDLATLHYRYGVNKTARTGNDVYGFQNYRDVNSDGNGVYIWDGDGVDTFDASNETQRVHINLKPGSWNYRGDAAEKMMTIKSSTAYNAVQFFGDEFAGAKAANETRSITEYVEGQSFIGFGTQIENAIGSAFNDTLLGNDVANNLIGNGGNDLIKGGKGNDYLNGGAGDDEMHGGEHDDTYVVDSEQDQVIELENQGTDTVFSTVDFTLKDHVEHLTLLGTTAKTATGNTLGNTLTANNVGNTLSGLDGDDTLIGGLEIDTLIGGAGSDTFVFNTLLNNKADIIQDFTAEDKIQLSRNIFTAITDIEQVFTYINHDKASGKLTYQANDTADPIHFATLQNFDAELAKNQFVLA